MEASISASMLPARNGPSPRTTPATPHIQLDQFAPADLQNELWTWLRALPHTTVGRSNVSEARSRAVHIAQQYAHGPADAYFIGTEFVHLHGDGSGSLHGTLPPEIAEAAKARGWAQTHPAVAQGMGFPTWVMIFAPRDGHELDVVKGLITSAYEYALDGTTP